MQFTRIQDNHDESYNNNNQTPYKIKQVTVKSVWMLKISTKWSTHTVLWRIKCHIVATRVGENYDFYSKLKIKN